MPKINRPILSWARKQAELSLEDAVQKLAIHDIKGEPAVHRLEALENGDEEPSRPMLLKMAKLYRRPLLTFYMSAPPRKGNRGQDFRTLPHDRPIKMDAIVDTLIRDICARQSMIRSVLEDEEEANPLSFVGSKKTSDGISTVLMSIRDVLQFDLDSFYKASSPSNAFSLLRASVEKQGIFVLLVSNLGSYHTTIEPEIFRGFAHADNIAPFIIINDRDAKTALSFTLLHELTHIWLGQTGISGLNSGNKIEEFCNDVAGEFLLPEKLLTSLGINSNVSYQETKNRISDFALSHKLSHSMIAYKLYRSNMISEQLWHRLSNEFRELWYMHRLEQNKKARETEGGPSYYKVHRYHLGTSLINIVQRMMSMGALTTSKAGKVLGVKAKNVQSLIGAH